MKKAFVTGGTGFIGQALIRRLMNKGWQVTALAQAKEKTTKDGLKKVDWCFGDIRSSGWHPYVKKASVFIHLVGIHGYHPISFKERLSVELEGTKNAILASQKAKVPHFIYVNSAFADANTDYGRTKKKAKDWVEAKIKKGLPATVVCPPTVYGPGDLVNFHRLFFAVARGRFFFVGSGKNTWQLIYIDDFINFLLRIMKRKKQFLGEILVLPGESVSLQKLVAIIAQETAVNPPKIHLPPIPMLIVGYFFSFFSHLGLPVPFTKDTILMLTGSQNCQVNKLKGTLSLQTQTNLPTGIKKTVKWYQKKHYF